MQDTTKAQEFFGQFAGKTIETMTLWAEANQRVLGELVELSAGTAKEGLRLCSELSRNAIDAFKEAQEGTYAQQAFRRAEENAQAMTRAAERLQASVEQAGKGIQESLAGAVARLKTLYANGGN